MNLYNTLLIQPVGEPGSGKTTLSFWLSQALKHANIHSEFVPEVVKYECFTDDGKKRVKSGRFDHRYLSTQMRMVKPLIGKVEVLINDGCLELFPLYGKHRMSWDNWIKLRDRVLEYRKLFSHSWFVIPERKGDYETQGRNETEEEASALRNEMLNYLKKDFNIIPINVSNEAERDMFFKEILNFVKKQRES